MASPDAVSHATSEPGTGDVAPIRSVLADDEIVASLLGVFLEELRVHLAAIRASMAKGDLPALSRLCHKARGAAATYGYPELSETLRTLEIEAAGPTSDLAKLRQGVDSLVPTVQRIARGIEAPH